MSVKKHSMLAPGDQPLSDKMIDFIAGGATPFHDEKMREFLLDQGHKQGGTHYYIYVNQEGFERRYGFLSLFESVYYISADATVWELSYDEPTSIQLLTERQHLPNEVELKFHDGDHDVTLQLSMPVVRDEHPSLDRYSNRNTQVLFEELKARVSSVV